MFGSIRSLFIFVFAGYVLLTYAMLFTLWLFSLGEIEAGVMMGALTIPSSLLLRDALDALDHLLMPRGSPPPGTRQTTGASSAPVLLIDARTSRTYKIFGFLRGDIVPVRRETSRRILTGKY